MSQIKSPSPSSHTRGPALRERVLDAAERLLRDGKADFSMRDLAAEAQVSFATPFNQFGSKAAIMHALSARRIDAMEERCSTRAMPKGAFDRLLAAVDIAVEVMLEEPAVNRSVLGWLGAAAPFPGRVRTHSTALWATALGDGDGFAPDRRDRLLSCLPTQLAYAFRGVLSFWTAGEISNEELGSESRAIAKTLLLGFTCEPRG